jgi:hypothetical protein
VAGGSTGNILGNSYTVNGYQVKPKYLCAEMSWAVRGLVGQIGEPIRVRLEIRLDPFLGVKLASLYKEGTCTS